MSSRGGEKNLLKETTEYSGSSEEEIIAITKQFDKMPDVQRSPRPKAGGKKPVKETFEDGEDCDEEMLQITKGIIIKPKPLKAVAPKAGRKDSYQKVDKKPKEAKSPSKTGGKKPVKETREDTGGSDEEKI